MVGKIASGKGEAAEFLKSEYKAEVFRFSDILKSVFSRLSMPNTRENLQALGRVLRTLFGDNVLVEALKHDIEASKAKMVVVDGVRYQVEADMVKSFPNSVLIYITAPDEVRYKRVLSRGTRGEKNITLEEFKKNEQNETEQAIDAVGAKADIKIENTGTIKQLHTELQTTISPKIK